MEVGVREELSRKADPMLHRYRDAEAGPTLTPPVAPTPLIGRGWIYHGDASDDSLALKRDGVETASSRW